MSCDDVWDAGDLIVPAIRDPGGFEPLMCCLCGHKLMKGRYSFMEGTICGRCRFLLDNTVRRRLALYREEEGGAV